MKSNVFVRKFARKAAFTSLAGVCLVPQGHVGVISQSLSATESATTEGNRFQAPRTITRSENVTLSFHPSSREWSKADEKEFKHLALREATEDITQEEMKRLNRLSSLRDHNSNPLSAEEVLLQIRRDRILERMAEVLHDYVEFTQSTGNKGTAA
jgi:microcompartment protein CcmL/EutN